MDFLSLLDSVKEDVQSLKEDILIKRHPLADEDLSLRFAYAVGVGMSATADGPLNEDEQAALKELSASLLIPEEQTGKVISMAATPDKAIITSVLGALSQREHQYIFLLDLRVMANKDGGTDPKKQQAIEQFAAMFKMSDNEQPSWLKLEKAVFGEKLVESEALFGKLYQRNATAAGTAGTKAYCALVYFWRVDAIRNELVALEKEINRIEDEWKRTAAGITTFGDRPSPRRYCTIDGEKYFLDDLTDLLKKLHGHNYKKIDDSAGEAWDNASKEAYEKRTQINTNFSNIIAAAELRRKFLAAAIDTMYINS